MKKVLIIVLAAFVLTGCAGTRIGEIASAVSSFTVSQNQLDALRSGYNAAFLAPAANYRQLPRCDKSPVKPCRTLAITNQLKAIDRTVLRNFEAVQALISSGNNTGLSAAWTLLQEAVSSAKNYALNVGIV